MIVILAIDALEHELVEKFSCENLKQNHYGKTDISEFSEPRTIVLWSSFLACENLEGEILPKGKEEMWNFKVEKPGTFFPNADASVIDLPGYSYDKEQHLAERKLLKEFFTTQDSEKKQEILEEYNESAFAHHKKIKESFLQALEEKHDLVIGYFSVADVVGHLNFGDELKIKTIYKEMDEIAQKIREKGCKLLVMSDHGMKAVGRFGDHSSYGFWSTNFKTDLNSPKITEIGKVIEPLLK